MGDDADVFDDPSRWRVEAVRALGLEGQDRIAGVVTGAAYPDALNPIVHALRAADGMVCDVGAGLGGASQWVAARGGVAVVAVEPERTSAQAATALFPGLRVAVGTATELPVASGRCAGVTLLGVVSLVDDLNAVLDEAVRVLDRRGYLGISDLCSVVDESHPPGSPNWFRSVDVLTQALEAHGLSVTDVWTAPADIETVWDDVSGRVDSEIERVHGDEPAYATWRDDRLRLRDGIAKGALTADSIVARLRPR